MTIEIHTTDRKAGYIDQKLEKEPASPTADIERMEISMPAEGIPVSALKNLICMLYSKQFLPNRATGSDVLWISDGVVERLKEFTPDTPERSPNCWRISKRCGT